MQVFLSKYMENFKVANEDAAFVSYQKRRYVSLLEDIQQSIKLSRDVADLDLQDHLKELERHHLKVSDWQIEPLANPDANFFDNVIVKYKQDLERRQKFEDKTDAVFIRRLVRAGDAVELVEKVYATAMDIKKKLSEQEALLAQMKLVKETNARLGILIKKKLDIKVFAAHKRQNSFDMTLDYTGVYMGDHNDLDNFESQMQEMRKSFVFDRNIQNHKLKDAPLRQEKKQ